MSHNESREFSVALCGFSENENKAIDRAFILSEIRPRRYVRWHGGHKGPDLCILNEDIENAADTWSHLQQEFGNPSVPVVRIGNTNRLDSLFRPGRSLLCKRPILASRLLRNFDELTIAVYRYAPELAIHDAISEDLIAEHKPVYMAPVHHASGSILVVDDSLSVRKMMEIELTKQGYAVDFAVTGEEALTQARAHAYDLVFLDIMLPGMDGYEVSRILKNELQVRAPVVMLTSRNSRSDRLRGSLAQADAYLTKPLTFNDLDETLRRYLKKETV